MSREVLSAKVLYDLNPGTPNPIDVRVLFHIREVLSNGEEAEYGLLFDPTKPEEGSQRWSRI